MKVNSHIVVQLDVVRRASEELYDIIFACSPEQISDNGKTIMGLLAQLREIQNRLGEAYGLLEELLEDWENLNADL